MPSDLVAAAYPLARAAIVEALGPDGLGRVALHVTQHAPEDGEPTLCVALARTEAAHDPAAWQASCFFVRTTPTPERFEWAVDQATRAALYQLGLP